MDGVAAVLAVLEADAALIALVPVENIAAGPRPLGTVLPAISLASVSKVDLNLPSPAPTRFVRERVQVTVAASNYPEQRAVLRAVRKAAADKLYPAVAGISGVTIHTESAGPDFMNEAGSLWLGSQDFLVKYNEER